jgi:hypothetical protein
MFSNSSYSSLLILLISRMLPCFLPLQWDNVTEAAKAMIGDMLVMDPEQRAPAQSLLQHRWFLSDGPAAAPAAALGAHMVRRLRAFANMNHMKRLALVVLARTLTDKDVNRLRVSARENHSAQLYCIAR